MNKNDLMFKNLYEQFVNGISEMNDNNNFVYIGETCFESEDENNNYNFEVFCGFKKTSNGKTEINFLFKDITETKIREKIKSEFDVKTLFFSKVAHEFKNPLICINELVKETNSQPEVQELLASTKFSKNMNQITAMSNFLIILVRDLEYFSQVQLDEMSSVKVTKSDTNLDEILTFVSDICNSLIKKANKANVLKYILNKAEEVPNIIYTDEWRLKQILINLLSNAVKFTLNGRITLNVSLEEEFIKFEVVDTGIGVSEDLQKKLFKPYGKGSGNLDNYLGTGLGLCIVKNLTSKLGNSIQYSSNERGTSFWFSLPLKPEEPIQLIPSPMTGKMSLNFDKRNYPNVKMLNDMKSSDNVSFAQVQGPLERQENDFFNILQQENREYNRHMSENSFSAIRLKNRLSNPTQQPKNKKIKLKHLLQKNLDEHIFNDPNRVIYNCIIADDEKVIRQSERRLISDIAHSKKLNINIIEADDGYDTLYLVYKCLQRGININLILSDQTMNYMTGIRSCELINELLTNKNMKPIPFYLVTAYENMNSLANKVTRVISKPIGIKGIEEILKECNILN